MELREGSAYWSTPPVYFSAETQRGEKDRNNVLINPTFGDNLAKKICCQFSALFSLNLRVTHACCLVTALSVIHSWIWASHTPCEGWKAAETAGSELDIWLANPSRLEKQLSTLPRLSHSQSPESRAKSSNWLIIRSWSLIASNGTCLKSFIQSSQWVMAWLKPRHVIAELLCAYSGKKTLQGVKMVLISFSLLIFFYYFSPRWMYVN